MKLYTEQQMKDCWERCQQEAAWFFSLGDNPQLAEHFTAKKAEYLASVEPGEGMRWVKASERLPYSVSDAMVRWIKDKKHCPDLLLFILKNKFLDELEWLDENTNQ